ncbi:Alpha/Beta hydrolase protein [Amylostereum chailletii]|nr:Alpha/Beta hydrolase protein [Amylostereum chailletii]
MVYELRRQPVKGLYLTFEALTIALIRIPWWTLTNIVPRFRARPSWTLRKAIMVNVLSRLNFVCSRIDILSFIADHLNVSEGPEIKLAWVDPVPPSLLSDPLNEWVAAAAASPMRIPGYWIDRPGLDIPIGTPIQPDEKVIYHFHGGGYTRLSASPRDLMVNISRGILTHTAATRRAFALEYRLSKAAPYPAENSFPAALLDALAGYAYLVFTIGVAPEDIILVGDSAGGNLAHALVRYLVEHPVLGLPAPGAVLLLSPWMDLTSSHDDDPNTAVDYLGRRDDLSTTWGRYAFFGPLGLDIQFSRYVSPASTDGRAEGATFAGWPRTMVSIRVLVERMREDMGEGVTYYEAEDAVHDYLLFLFWEPERTETLNAIAAWVGE